MADHHAATVTLPSGPASPAAARRLVAAFLCEFGVAADDGVLDALRLIVSELATNAVQHTQRRSPAFTVTVRLDEAAGRLDVGVTDSHPRLPRRLPAAVQENNGRGLVIVRTLAAESGGRLRFTRSPGGGKTVWVTLPWPASSAA